MPKKQKTFTEYRHYDLPAAFPVLLLSGDKWHISDVKSNRLHFHNCLEIGICLSETGYMEFEGVQVAFQAGDISCVPRNLPHTTYSSPGAASLWSYIFTDLEALFPESLTDGSDSLNLSLTNIPDFRYLYSKESFPKLHFLVSSIVEELEQKPDHYQLSVRGLLLAFCLEIQRYHQSALSVDTPPQRDFGDGSTAIAPALDYISKYYMQTFSVRELADLCHLSETHFRRIFHTATGTSPLEFINNTRIYHACILLKTTEESILFISEAVGFNSVSTFNRCFSKSMGTSPRDWKKNVLFEEGKADHGAAEKYHGWL